MTKRIGIFALIAISVCSCALSFGAGAKGKADGQAVWDASTIAATYEYRSDFTVPAREIAAGTERVTAESVVIYPDGSATKNTAVSLEQSGKYEVRYVAKIGGKTYVESCYFTVYPPTFVCSSNASAINYVENYKFEFPYTFVNDDGTATTNPTTRMEYTSYNKTGLMVELKRGDSFECSEYIDVSALDKADSLVALTMMPYVTGESDLEQLNIVLTDSVDESVSLKVRVRAHTDTLDSCASFILAGGQNQPLKGWEASRNAYHVNNEWGTVIIHSFNGSYEDDQRSNSKGYYGLTYNKESHTILDIAYDYAENAVYANTKRVCDLDDPEAFSTLWSGFPSGKVKLSITGDEYKGDTARFLIQSIAGIDLASGLFEDKTAPELTVDCDYDFENMPAAKKGCDYVVPAAIAFDEYSGECEVKVSVYYNYGLSNAASVKVSNGKFTTDKAGIYAVVYEAEDNNGNKATEILWIECKKTVDEIVINKIDGYDVTAVAGKTLAVAEVETSGGSGDITVKTYASFGGKKTEISKSFVPDRTGEWRIEYVATDYIGQTKTDSYTVTVSANAVPLFIDKPALPFAYISGTAYKVPVLYADDYSSGSLNRVLASVEVADANGVNVYTAGQTFVPTAAEGAEKVTLKFIAGGAEKSFELPCVLVKDARGLLLVEKYFVLENATSEKTDGGVVIRATGDNAKASFVNSLVSESFSIELAAVSGASSFDNFSVKLTDEENESLSVTLQLKNAGTHTVMQNGDNSAELGVGFGQAGKAFTLTYSEKKFYIGKTYVEIAKTDDGKVFEGFTSNKVRLECSINGVDGDSAMQICAINTQGLSKSTILDFIAPQIYLTGNYGGSFAFGETVTITKAVYADVLDPAATCVLSVSLPSGGYATDVNGVLLKEVDPTKEYRLKLDEIGSYIIRYSALDSSENQSKREYSIISEDVTAPVLKVNGSWKNATLGSAYVLPVITATDDSGKAVTLRIMITDPNGKVTVLNENVGSVKFAVKGKHLVSVVAIDEAGNTSYVKAAIEVK